MKKCQSSLLTVIFVLVITQFSAQPVPTHVTNTNLTPYTLSKFAQSNDFVFFLDDQFKLNYITKVNWKGNVVIDESNVSPHIKIGSGLLWSNDKIFFTNVYNDIQYYTLISNNNFPIWTLSSPINTYKASHQTDFAESSSNIYYVDSDRKVRAISKSSLANGYVLNPTAPLAKAGTDLLWKDGKLFYIAETNKIFYFHFANGNWQIEGQVGSNLNSDASNTNLAASTNNIYYLDNSDHVRLLSIGTIGSWWYNAPIDVNAPLAEVGSDLLWHDSKLFYISNNSSIDYFTWNNSAWQNSNQEFITPTNTAGINIYTNLIGVDDEILLNVGNRLNYFRSPVKLESILNPVTKSGWQIEYNEEFTDYSFANHWTDDYLSKKNHPMVNIDPVTEHGESMYYNVTGISPTNGTSNHNLLPTAQPTYLELLSEDCIPLCNVSVQKKDRNDPSYSPPGPGYQYKSAMLHAMKNSPFDRKYGYFEIRCKTPTTNKEKYTFWLWGNADASNVEFKWFEIDVFEIEGDGKTFPTNYHETYRDPNANPKTRADRYDIFPLVGQNFNDDYYTYAVSWTDEEITWYINNKIVRRIHKDRQMPVSIADGNMTVRIQPRIWNKNYGNVPLNFPNSYNIDYVRVYSKIGPPRKKYIKSESSIQELSLYPNPTNQKLTISVNETTLIQITNVNGSIVFKKEVTVENPTINVDHLPAGLYIVSSSSDDFKPTKLIINSK